MMLKRIGKRVRSMSRQVKRDYETLSPEDYLFNQRDSMMVTKRQKTELVPLPNSNHSEGTTDRIALVGIPSEVDSGHQDVWTDDFQQLLFEYRPDLINLQIDPSRYIARQRFLAHKHAQQEIEDYDIKAIECTDLHAPESWEETVVSLSVLDMLKHNKVHTELDLTRSYATFSHPEYQGLEGPPEGLQKEMTEPLIQAITQNIMGDNFSTHYGINQALYTCLLGKHRVQLGGMPETLYRQIIGNSVTLEEMQDFFRFAMDKRDQLEQPIDIKQAALRFLPHIFQTPKDLYQTAILKESFACSVNMLSYVEMPQYIPVQRYWEPAPHGINYTEATRIPDRLRGETDEMLVEKQALLDVILQSRAWGQSWVVNPFPYLVNDITQVETSQLGDMKKCFKQNLIKYTNIEKEAHIKQIRKQDSNKKIAFNAMKIPNLNIKQGTK